MPPAPAIPCSRPFLRAARSSSAIATGAASSRVRIGQQNAADATTAQGRGRAHLRLLRGSSRRHGGGRSAGGARARAGSRRPAFGPDALDAIASGAKPEIGKRQQAVAARLPHSRAQGRHRSWRAGQPGDAKPARRASAHAGARPGSQACGRGGRSRGQRDRACRSRGDLQSRGRGRRHPVRRSRARRSSDRQRASGHP